MSYKRLLQVSLMAITILGTGCGENEKYESDSSPIKEDMFSSEITVKGNEITIVNKKTGKKTKFIWMSPDPIPTNENQLLEYLITGNYDIDPLTPLPDPNDPNNIPDDTVFQIRNKGTPPPPPPPPPFDES